MLDLLSYGLLLLDASLLSHSIQTAIDAQPAGPELVTLRDVLIESFISLLPALAMLGPYVVLLIGLKKRCIYDDSSPAGFLTLAKLAAFALSVGVLLLVDPFDWILGVRAASANVLVILADREWVLDEGPKRKITSPGHTASFAIFSMFISACCVESLAEDALEASVAGERTVVCAAVYCIAVCLLRIYALSDLCSAETMKTLCVLADVFAGCGLVSVALYKASAMLSGNVLPRVTGLDDVFLHSISLLALSRYRLHWDSELQARPKAE